MKETNMKEKNIKEENMKEKEKIENQNIIELHQPSKEKTSQEKTAEEIYEEFKEKYLYYFDLFLNKVNNYAKENKYYMIHLIRPYNTARCSIIVFFHKTNINNKAISLLKCAQFKEKFETYLNNKLSFFNDIFYCKNDIIQYKRIDKNYYNKDYELDYEELNYKFDYELDFDKNIKEEDYFDFYNDALELFLSGIDGLKREINLSYKKFVL